MMAMEKKGKILIVDDNEDVLLSLDMNFHRDAISGEEGYEWLEKILAHNPKSVVLFITAYVDTEKAVRAINRRSNGLLQFVENIELPLLYMGVSGKERRKRAEDVMERVAISHRAKHFPSQLSGGQQQRAAIARAILPHPKLILADEPTGNLDSKNGKEVMELLFELHKEGTTIVMVTHSLHDANYADRIINMFDGEIVNQVEM